MLSSVTEAAPSCLGEKAEPNTFSSLLGLLWLSPKKISTTNNFLQKLFSLFFTFFDRLFMYKLNLLHWSRNVEFDLDGGYGIHPQLGAFVTECSFSWSFTRASRWDK
jgi:hypothetical protein